MAQFKDHKVTASQLLGVIPEGLLSHLSATTCVDYYSKVLHGKKMFYLLMYGVLENDRLSQRTLEDTFNDSVFKTLFSLDKVYLYTGVPINNKRGNMHHRQELVEEPFRLIEARSKTDSGQLYCFITNDFELSAKEVTDAYRRRWDIEVFFRFIKQELNFSHLVSLNKNGLQVMLYMTLIVAMLVLIYKRANNIGYKTAKRRFSMELRDLAIAMIVLQCGGDPKVYFKT